MRALTLAALTLAALTLAACIDIGISSIGIVIESMAVLALEVRTGIVSIRSFSFSWFASYTMW